MRQIRSFLAMICVVLIAAPATYAQQNTGPAARVPQVGLERRHWYSGITHDYEQRPVPPVNVSNTGRLDSLLRAGRLYLSLQDAIALAMENNLEVEIERYEFALADADLLRAKSGAAIEGIPTGVFAGVPANAGSLPLGSPNAGLSSAAIASPLVSFPNSPPLSFDPIVIGNLNFGHSTAPQASTFVTGTTSLITTNKTANFGILQSYGTGGTAALTFDNNVIEQNNFRSSINPATASFLDLSYSQPLLQGFGLALNRRTIRIAQNDLRAADYVFRQQLINVVANVVALYWNLVAAIATVGVQQQAVAVAQKLYDDNTKQVEVGTLAPLEIIRAEAQLATAQQGLVAAQSVVDQLEMVLKSSLSRNGLASPSVLSARVAPTDPMRIPEVEPVEPVQDLMAEALDNRPDLAQSRVQIENAKIALTGTKNQLLPILSAVGDVRSSALAGTQNTVAGPANSSTGLVQTASPADPFFVGGFGDVLGQLFRRNFPNYSVGVNLAIPLGNRQAQSNIATATLNLRQSELVVQRQINQIRVDVENALIGLQTARAQYQAAVKGRILQEQTLDADEKKLAEGITTVYQVIQDQRDLTTAAAAEIAAQNTYVEARNLLDLATGTILQRNNVEFDEAKSGRISRPPSPLPAEDAVPATPVKP